MNSAVHPPCDAGVIRGGVEAKPSGEAAGRWVLAATILGSSLAFIDGTVVNIALPAMQASLHANIAQVQWIVEAYSLLLAALILVGGSLGDHLGRRKIYALGVAVFALASAWCGLAPNVTQLIWARAVQGVGGALLVPGSLALISAAFPKEKRGQAIGTWSGWTAITTALGPALGGWLVQHIGWRAIFFLNLPLAVAVLAITLLRVPESRDEGAPAGLDFLGAALAVLGLGGVVYGLIDASTAGLTSPRVLTFLVVGLVLLAAFVAAEARSKSPMMPLGLFRLRTFAGTNGLTLLLYAALGGALFFLPFDLIQVQHYSPTAAGLALLPFVLLMSGLSRWSGGLVAHYGARKPLLVGPTVAAAGFALLARPGVGGSYWTDWFPAILALGLGMAVSVAPLTTAVMGSVETRYAGVASGVNNAVSRVAGLVAIAALSLVLTAAFGRSLDRRLGTLGLPPTIKQQVMGQRGRLAATLPSASLPPAQRQVVAEAVAGSYVAGFRLVMGIAAALALLSAVCAAFLIDDGKEVDGKEKETHDG